MQVISQAQYFKLTTKRTITTKIRKKVQNLPVPKTIKSNLPPEKIGKIQILGEKRLCYFSKFEGIVEL